MTGADQLLPLARRDELVVRKLPGETLVLDQKNKQSSRT